MDDSTKVIAKLPNPNAGLSHLTTASEAATREFVSHTSTTVSKALTAPGKPLGSLWHQMPKKSRLETVSQIVEFESRLSSPTFESHGCIYFRETIPDQPNTSKPLITNPPISSTASEHFTLGPLTTAELWDCTHADFTVDRGPWDTLLEYVEAMGRNELEWVKRCSKPRKVSYRATEDPELPEEVISLINAYLRIAPSLVAPVKVEDIHSPNLWHPDLHRDNVFVDPHTNKITGIIDWQSAAVTPLFLQCGVPRMFRHSKSVEQNWAVPEKPSDYEDLSPEEQARVDADIEGITYHKYYKYQSLKKSPRHWACLEQQDAIELRTAPIRLVTNCCWRNSDVFWFREALMAVVKRWNDLDDSGSPCPIHFSEEVYRLHALEDANMSAVGEILKIFRDECVLPVDGMVNPVYFQRVKKDNMKFKDTFVGLASTPEEKKLHERIWPYQDSDSWEST
ncbi:MAG: hypothetical protein M1818_002564 [Claussenomyces sp. TS43310]|nr:MAG: hypothetical protein M1818_002564 [Claussenomyces sp. TS43310]